MYNSRLVLVLVVWTLVWKGIALWKSVERRQLIWFVLLLILNTLGLLEILYILFLNRWDIDGGRLLAFLEDKLGKKKGKRRKK